MIEIKFTPAQDNWLEVTWADDGKEVKHTSYHPTQLDLLQADAAALGTPLDDHTDMLNEWVASYVPPEPEPEPIPQTVTMRQARLALLAVGLLDDVETAVKAAPKAAQIEWEYATQVERTWPTLALLAGALGLNDEALDALFTAAAGM